jgi:hypothetical protein
MPYPELGLGIVIGITLSAALSIIKEIIVKEYDS